MTEPATPPEFRELDERFEIPVVQVSSRDPFERGVQHGEQAAAQIAASIDYYRALFRDSHGLDWGEVARRAAVWEPIVAEYDADLQSEARGIAEGSSHSLGDILALNARGEMVYAQFLKTEGCTSFALIPGEERGHVFAGQNWDWRSGARAGRIVLRIEQPPKPTVTTILEAGQLGRHGANSAGVALFANGLPAGPSAPGVPQAFIRRRILDQERIAGALDVVFGSRQQIPANLLLAHRDGFAIDVETTPRGHRWAYPTSGVIAHANHYEYFHGEEYQPRLGSDSLYRSFRMREGLERIADRTDVPAVRNRIAATLADRFGTPDAIAAHPDPELAPPLRWETLTSSILDLTEGTWFVADGPPDVRPYVRLPWSLHEH